MVNQQPEPRRSRATPDFQETGSTQNQRLHRMEQTRQTVSDPMLQRAQRFSESFLSAHPGAEEFAGQALALMGAAPQQPAAPDLSQYRDLGTGGVLRVYEHLRRRPHQLSSADAARLEQLMGQFRGQ